MLSLQQQCQSAITSSYLSISHYIIGNDLEQGGIEKLLGNEISSLHFSLFKDITIAVVCSTL